MCDAPRRSAPANENELLLRARALAGRSVSELAQALGVALPVEPKRAKGFVGQLVELALGADPLAGERPDFVDLGIELKTIPVGRHGKPAESTFCCSISIHGADTERWETSRLRNRIRRVLFVPVDSARQHELGARRFHSSVLWSPDPAQDEVLRGDWFELMGRVGAGLPTTAHLGRALQIRPKARDSRVRVVAIGEERSPVAFYLRSQFTAQILTQGRGATE